MISDQSLFFYKKSVVLIFAPISMSARSRAYVFTINNPDDADADAVDALGVHDQTRYLICGGEVGEGGTPHLQGYVYFKTMKTLAQCSKLLSRARLEAAKGTPEQNRVYCSKEGSFKEFGTIPMSQQTKGKRGADYWEEQLSHAKAGRVEDCDPKLQITHQNALQSIAVRYQGAPSSDDWKETPHLWYYGPTGSGKTRKALLENPGAYMKNCDQWWQGYQGQACVIIDDIDKYHVKLGYYLKRWADHSPFVAEIKNSSLLIRPPKIIVTSNYSPEEIWDDANTLDPIRRRFKVVHMGAYQDISNFYSKPSD